MHDGVISCFLSAVLYFTTFASLLDELSGKCGHKVRMFLKVFTVAIQSCFTARVASKVKKTWTLRPTKTAMAFYHRDKTFSAHKKSIQTEIDKKLPPLGADIWIEAYTFNKYGSRQLYVLYVSPCLTNAILILSNKNSQQGILTHSIPLVGLPNRLSIFPFFTFGVLIDR